MENSILYTPRREGFWSFDVGKKILDLSDNLLPAMTQDQSANHRTKDGFVTCTIPQFFSICGKLYEMRGLGGKDGEFVESARQFIKQSIMQNGINTQSRISYFPSSQNVITHGYGMENPIVKNVDFVGQDGNLVNVLSLEASLALTEKKPEDVGAIMDYLNGTSNYVWRLNSKPATFNERVVWLGADSGWFDLDCSGDPRDARASFGVRVREKNI